jgi:predicted nucleic acid-binding protein
VRIYLDVCAIQRPLDTPEQIRVILEAEAVLGILAFCDAGQLELVSSDALIYETEQNPLPVRQEHARAILSKAAGVIRISDEIRSRSSQLIEFGLKPLDALHLALAEAGKVDYFCTCDDSLLARVRRVSGMQVRTISPIDLVRELEK